MEEIVKEKIAQYLAMAKAVGEKRPASSFTRANPNYVDPLSKFIKTQKDADDFMLQIEFHRWRSANKKD